MYDKILIVVGKTMSGKTTYVNGYLKERGFNQVKTHTTRPQRKTESNDAYHFETEVNKNGLALREYDMVDGHVAYWVDPSDIEETEHPVIIIDVQGAVELIKYLGKDNVRIAYVNTSDETILKRMRKSKRGKTEDESETMRRYMDDVNQFRKLDLFFTLKGGIDYIDGSYFLGINS